MFDFLDPNNWEQDDHEYRVYADDYANVYALVDQIDYQYVIQWRWKLKQSRVHLGTKIPKVYLCRAVPAIVGNDYYDENGKRFQNRVTSTVYLHTVIMERKGDLKPKTNKRIITDHGNGNGFDCRRYNLRYTTISFNNRNRYGSHEHQLEV